MLRASGIPLTLIHSYLIEDWFTPVEGNAFLAGKAVVSWVGRVELHAVLPDSIQLHCRNLKFPRDVDEMDSTVPAIETNKGTANGVVRLWERVKAERFALAMTPLVEAERLARKTERFSERPDKNG
jgi:hypothetical protein